MSTSKKIQATKNYRLFARSDENRPMDPKKHRKLETSMKLYGFLKCFPVVCFRDKNGSLIVKDGQHRLAFAESLGLTVYWVEEDVDFDVALVNCTAKTWQLKDYAQKHAANGKTAYRDGLDFAEAHGVSIGTAFALLAGQTSISNIWEGFVSGAFKVKDRAWADSVAGIYGPLVALSGSLNNKRFIEACMAVCRVPEFDGKRLIANAERCREKLVPFSTRDAYLDMLETIYNFGRKSLVGLRSAAMMAMRERNVCTVSKKAKAEKAA